MRTKLTTWSTDNPAKRNTPITQPWKNQATKLVYLDPRQREQYQTLTEQTHLSILPWQNTMIDSCRSVLWHIVTSET